MKTSSESGEIDLITQLRVRAELDTLIRAVDYLLRLGFSNKELPPERCLTTAIQRGFEVYASEILPAQLLKSQVQTVNPIGVTC